MAELKSAAMMEDDEWMNCLRNSNVNIFDIIKSAIMVAASDHPQEFNNKRKMIAQTLFSCDLINCEKQSMINNVGGENDDETTVAQVLKIKQVLDQSNIDESVLFESLSKLQHMVKSVSILKVTGVGISVNTLRKHPSKNVAKISTTLVKKWKCMVDKWMKESENMQQQKGGESETNPKNPPKTDKQLTVPASKKKGSLIVRIKLKKVEPKGPETPEQKVQNDKDDGVARILRIKGVIDDVNVSESAVLESLMKLLEMSLSVKTLQETRIGSSVRVLLQKHGSKDVRQIAWGLLMKWEGMVDEYIKKESSLKTERKIKRVGSEESKDRMKEGIEEKFNATKRKLEKACGEAEKMKRKRRIQVKIIR